MAGTGTGNPLRFESFIDDAKFMASVKNMSQAVSLLTSKVEADSTRMGNAFVRLGQLSQIKFLPPNIKDQAFLQSLKNMERGISDINRRSKEATEGIGSSFDNLIKLSAAYFGVDQLKNFVTQLVSVRGEFQQLEVAFTTMLKSKGASDKLISELATLAATTPFGLKDVAAGAKQLLAYGSSASQVTNELRTLGDVAAGTSTPLGDLVYLYGTLRTQGRAYAVDIRQFAGRGIPIYAELAKVLKINTDEVNKFVEDGKVGFKEVQQAFANMTGQGGLFFNLMDAQSKTITGQIERLKDAFQLMLNELGKGSEGVIGGALGAASLLIENYEEILSVLGVLVATYGTYKAAVMATMAVEALAATAKNVKIWLQLASSIKTAGDAQAAFNLATAANPYALAAAALAALVAVVVLYNREMTQAEKVQEALNQATKDANKAGEEELVRIRSLVDQIKNEKNSRDDRNKALQKLIDISPGHLQALNLENIATAEGTTLIKGYTDALKARLKLEGLAKQREESLKRTIQYENGEVELTTGEAVTTAAKGFFRSFTDMNAKYSTDEKAAKQQKINKGLKEEEVIRKNIDEQIEAERSGINDLITAEKERTKQTMKSAEKSVAYYDNLIKSKKDDLEKATSRSQYKTLDKQLKELERQKRLITGESAPKVKLGDAPSGSVDYYEKLVKDYETKIQRTPTDQKGTIAKLKAYQIDAQNKLEAARKEITTKSLEEELEEKRKKYQLYYKWVEGYGREAADKEFSSLLSSGKDYINYIQAEIKKYEDLDYSEGLGSKEVKYLQNLKVELASLDGRETPMERFAKSFDQARDSATSLTEELYNLQSLQTTLPTPEIDMSETAVKMRKQVAEAIVETDKARRKELDGFLAEVSQSEQKRAAIATYYNNLRAALDKKYTDNRGEEYQQMLWAIDKAEKDALAADKLQYLEQSQAYKALQKTILTTGKAAITQRLEEEKKALEEIKGFSEEEEEERRKRLKAIADYENQLMDLRMDKMQKFGAIIGELGTALGGSGSGIAIFGESLNMLSSSVSNISKAMKEAKTNGGDMTNVYTGLASLLISLISNATGAYRKLREEQRNYGLAVLDSERQLALLRNKEIGQASSKRENVFVKDFTGRVKDGIKMMNDARTNLENSITGLMNNGMFKTGITDGIVKDQGLFKRITSGIENAFKAVFGGNVSEEKYTSLLEKYPGLIQKSADGWLEVDKSLAQVLISQDLVDDNTKQLLQSAIDFQDQIDAAKEQIKGVVSELAGGFGNTLRDALVEAFRSGSDAAEAFRKTVSGVLEDILSQIIFSQVFGKAFTQLQDDLTNALAGQGTVLDALKGFYDQSPDLIKQWEDIMKLNQKLAEQAGFDIFKKSQEETNNDKGMSGSIRSLSESTGNALLGQMNAIRINQVIGVEIMRNQLTQLTIISSYTSYLPEMAQSLQRMSNSDPLRAKGLTG